MALIPVISSTGVLFIDTFCRLVGNVLILVQAILGILFRKGMANSVSN